MNNETEEPVSFLTMLKHSWQPLAAASKVGDLPRGSQVILCGIISIARQIASQEEDSISSVRSRDSLSSLGMTVNRSLESWEASWGQFHIEEGAETSSVWRNCACVVRLAHTLYEISPVDLQTISGGDTIGGRKIGPMDYARSRRRLRSWAHEDRGLRGVSRTHVSPLPWPISLTPNSFRCGQNHPRSSIWTFVNHPLPPLPLVPLPRRHDLLELRFHHQGKCQQ